ncbi:hypothetical protein [Falsiroseomonas sp.]|uniref:hypothetical protein n=1 Tax=Falsiroseomonas sp. TaxID=2870721 RepID=UPI0034A416CA
MKHPPFRGGPALGGDFLTKEGANRLAERIRAAWAKAGHPDVYVTVDPSGAAVLEKNQFYVVRMPGLLNGLPR